MVVDRTGTIPAVTGEALARQVAHFEEAANDIGG